MRPRFWNRLTSALPCKVQCSATFKFSTLREASTCNPSHGESPRRVLWCRPLLVAYLNRFTSLAACHQDGGRRERRLQEFKGGVGGRTLTQCPQLDHKGRKRQSSVAIAVVGLITSGNSKTHTPTVRGRCPVAVSHPPLVCYPPPAPGSPRGRSSCSPSHCSP